jgi:hypothetical protein
MRHRARRRVATVLDDLCRPDEAWRRRVAAERWGATLRRSRHAWRARGIRDAVTRVAYPKARQLGTDLNRDSLAALPSEKGIRAMRQIAIDDVWSALRFRPGP